MGATDGCDMLPFRAARTDSPVAIPFGMDYEIEVGFVRDGEVLWSNAGDPVLLSTLIAESATAADLAEVAFNLAAALIRRRAEAALASPPEQP